MKLEQFKYLEKEQKKQLLFDNGIYLTFRKEMDYTIYLYQVDAFYVEIFIHEDEEEIGYMRGFSSLNGLTPYLCHIDISQVLNILL